MATMYKTPGVYIDEIPKFPPSIAPVETAIPAFIGYTEKADRFSPGDLHNVPTRIGSLAEYEHFFGGAAMINVVSVSVDENRNFKFADLSNTFYMYDSLRLFYTNGGGDCYIVSTGTYAEKAETGKEPAKGDFSSGIASLEKVDEPTILLFPDNSLLGNTSDFYGVYDDALAQCGFLMDRVGLFDVHPDDPNGTDFRSGTGIKDLKYGAAYTPWLSVNFPKSVTYRDFRNVIKVGGGTLVNLADLTGGKPEDAPVKKIKALIASYEQLINDSEAITTATAALVSSSCTTMKERYIALKAAYQKDAASKTAATFIKIVFFLYQFATTIDSLVAGASPVGDPDVLSALKKVVSPTMTTIFTTLIGYDLELKNKVKTGYSHQFTNCVVKAPEWGDIFNKAKYDLTVEDKPENPVHPSSVITGTTDAGRMDSMLPNIEALFEQLNTLWLGSVASSTGELEQARHEGLAAAFPLYKSILDGIRNASTEVPPSGAVAGIYAYVDRTRGVWKAPANISISGIVGPTATFTSSQLEALNVDPNSGKSVNAIRKFTGKGTLVYGARTLAGNDNEWRYVSVRRFFNFVEESTKKATEQFVFEPNDANTWVRVQAMIENFLTVLWRQGALQGIKPEHAFYVSVGLGKTMTPLDILEGRMIIEIGMAAVRPAEFIILKFSHKMVES